MCRNAIALLQAQLFVVGQLIARFDSWRRNNARRIWASTPQKSYYYEPTLKFKLNEALHYLRNNRVRLQPSLTGTPDRFTRFEMIDEIFYKSRMCVWQRGLMQFNQSF